MSGGDSAPPTAAPVLKMPMPSARSRTGNHSPTTLAAPGQLPASPKPEHAAEDARMPQPCAPSRARAAASDHTTIEKTNPSRVPMTS